MTIRRTIRRTQIGKRRLGGGKLSFQGQGKVWPSGFRACSARRLFEGNIHACHPARVILWSVLYDRICHHPPPSRSILCSLRWGARWCGGLNGRDPRCPGHETRAALGQTPSLLISSFRFSALTVQSLKLGTNYRTDTPGKYF